MKDRRDWGPADEMANAEMKLGCFLFFVIMLVVACATTWDWMSG